MATPAWAGELIALVRLHTAKGTLVMGWELLHARLVELGLASVQQVLPQFARFRAAAERCVNVHEYMHVRNLYGIIN